MDDIRLFIKKNAIAKIQLSIAYNNTHTTYKYKYLDSIILFNEYLPDFENDDDGKIEMIFNKKTYDNLIDIQLILFDLFDYKTIDYIDVYIQKKLLSTNLILTDLYDDYFDDTQNKLICSRRFSLNGNEIIKFKFVVISKDITLYYQTETINGIDNIIKKIDELLH